VTAGRPVRCRVWPEGRPVTLKFCAPASGSWKRCYRRSPRSCTTWRTRNSLDLRITSLRREDEARLQHGSLASMPDPALSGRRRPWPSRGAAGTGGP